MLNLSIVPPLGASSKYCAAIRHLIPSIVAPLLRAYTDHRAIARSFQASLQRGALISSTHHWVLQSVGATLCAASSFLSNGAYPVAVTLLRCIKHCAIWHSCTGVISYYQGGTTKSHIFSPTNCRSCIARVVIQSHCDRCSINHYSLACDCRYLHHPAFALKSHIFVLANCHSRIARVVIQSHRDRRSINHNSLACDCHSLHHPASALSHLASCITGYHQ